LGGWDTFTKLQTWKARVAYSILKGWLAELLARRAAECGLSRISAHATTCPLDLGNTQVNTSHVKFRALVSSFILAAVSIGAGRARLQQPAAPPQLPEPPPQLTPSEIEIYKRAKRLIDWTPRQIHHCPFLHKLRPAGSQDQLRMVLERVGQTVTLLFHDFPRIACDEEVLSETSLRDPLAPEKRRNAKLRKFRYIVIPWPVGDFPAFDEYRTDLKGNPLDDPSLGDFFWITFDFASTWLYLSPANQHVSRFRHFGIETIRKRECHVVGFAQDPERARSVGELRMGGKSVVLLVQGLAWIDSETFQVLRIKTWLLAPRTDIGLTNQTSTVDFYPVQPSAFERVLWLPGDVVVMMDYRDNWFRNTHHYSNYKLFRVDSAIKPAE
jgi:hypothetical protein